MKNQVLTACVLAAVAGASARAGDVQLHMLGEFYATAVSGDGSVVAGNSADNTFETVRWTQSMGVQFLGGATVPTLGTGAGTPGISDDGTRISATILSEDATHMLQGVWSEGAGWQFVTPYPSDAGIVDSSLSSAWSISGDGNKVVGLYWRAGQTDGIAHASIGSLAGGVGDLGSFGGSSRANDANYDGSVVVGWDEASDGHWRSVVWVNGVETILHDQGAFTEAVAVNSIGDVVVGDAWNNDTATREAAAWRWNGSTWEEQILGVLPGTFPSFGRAVANCISGDGSIIGGFNAYDFGPFSDSTGFIWTAEMGMVSIESYLAHHGVAVDPLFDFTSITGISADGLTLVGYGTDWRTFTVQSFKITIPAPGSLALVGLGVLGVARRRRA
jgi:uncharacterized membrane protein